MVQREAFYGLEVTEKPRMGDGLGRTDEKPLIVIGSFNNYKRSDTADNGSRTRLSSLGS